MTNPVEQLQSRNLFSFSGSNLCPRPDFQIPTESRTLRETGNKTATAGKVHIIRKLVSLRVGLILSPSDL